MYRSLSEHLKKVVQSSGAQKAAVLVAFVLGLGLVAFAQSGGGWTIQPFPPPNNSGTASAFTFQSPNVYHFTRTDGAFGPVVIWDNSATPGYPYTNDFSMDSINVDGQRDLATYHYNAKTGSYGVSTLLNLDQDSHFILGAATGAGIGSDPHTGDTCIPSSISIGQNGCNLANAMHWTIDGTVNKYQGLATDGNGISTIAKVLNGSVTGGVTNFPVWTTPASGYGAADYYEVSWVGVVTGASPNTTAVATWSFTDESGPNFCTSAQVGFGGVGNRLELTCRFFSVPNSPISFSLGTFGGSPTYVSHVRVLIH